MAFLFHIILNDKNPRFETLNDIWDNDSMKRKYQLLYIHGGTTFKNKKEYLYYLKERSISLEPYQSFSGDYLENSLGKKYQVIRPKMPLKENALYQDWKIYFERYFNLLDKKVVLVGNSLGAIFLAKYLSENSLKEKAPLVILIAPPFDDSLKDERLLGGFKLRKNLNLLIDNVDNLYLLFSSDDQVVDLSQMNKYKAKLKGANFRVYRNKNGHFRVKTFKELINIIKKHEN